MLPYRAKTSYMCGGALWEEFQRSLQFLHGDGLGCVKEVRGLLEDATVDQLRPTWGSICPTDGRSRGFHVQHEENGPC